MIWLEAIESMNVFLYQNLTKLYLFEMNMILLNHHDNVFMNQNQSER